MKSQRKIHPYAEIFPLVEGPQLWELSDRIKANGLREPIVLLGDEILDGRRRELACIRAGIEPTYRTFGSRSTDGFDPLEYVIDTNLHRRHLGDGDRALAAARYAKAKIGNQPKRQTPQVAEFGAEDSAKINGHTQSVADSQTPQLAEFGADCPPPTNADAAEKFDVSEDAVTRAKVVIANGTPELQQALAADIVTVSDAAKVATEPPYVQNAALEEVKKGKARSAARAAQKIKKVWPTTLCDEAKKAFTKKITANETQIVAFAEFDEPTQQELVKSIIAGRQTLANAIETGEVPELTVDEILKAKNHEIESFCRKLGDIIKEMPEDDWLNYNGRRDSALQKFRDGIATLRCMKCHDRCPKCQGAGCKDCLRTGRVPKAQYDQLAG